MENKKEVWKDVKGFEGVYQISNLGRVKSLERIIHDKSLIPSRIRSYTIKERIRKPSFGTHGYFTIPLYVSSEKRSITTNIHRLIAIAFIPNPNNYPFVNHINSIRHDNRIENLEWCTPKQNTEHAMLNNRMNPLRGEQHYSSKLKNEDIPRIKEMSKNGMPASKICLIFSVSGTSIRSVINNKSWTHIK